MPAASGVVRSYAVFAKTLTIAASPVILRSSLPLNVLILIGATPLFAPQGLSASFVTSMMRTSVGLRVGLWSAWLLLTVPVARALLILPPAAYLRSLPISDWMFSLVSAVHLLLVEAAWIILFLRGEGPMSAVAAGGAAIAAHSLLVARRWRLSDWLAALLLAVAIVWPFHPPLLLGVAASAGAIGLSSAWRTATEVSLRTHLILVSLPRLLALTGSHLLRFLRVEHTSIWRGFLIVACIAVWPMGMIRGDNPSDSLTLERIVLAFAALPLLACTSPLAVSAQAMDARDEWVFIVTGVHPYLRQAAATVAVGGLGAFTGAMCGALIGFGALRPTGVVLRFMGLEAVWGATLATLVMAIVWREPRLANKRAFVFLVLQMGMLATAGAAGLGALAVPAGIVISSIFAVRAGRTARFVRSHP